MKVAPPAGPLSAVILPSCRSRIFRVIESPRPVPLSFVVKNGWKTFPSLSGGIPGPSSVTDAITYRARCSTASPSAGTSPRVRTVSVTTSGEA